MTSLYAIGMREVCRLANMFGHISFIVYCTNKYLVESIICGLDCDFLSRIRNANQKLVDPDRDEKSRSCVIYVKRPYNVRRVEEYL